MRVRQAVFAGSWYPARAAKCQREIEQFVAQAPPIPEPDTAWVGGIVPHAGWFYSGSIACNVIRQLQGDSPVDTIAIFGMHLHPGSANYIMAEGAWETPFGALPIDQEIAAQLVQRFEFQIETATRFSQDNTIELQLPFIRYFFPEVAIVPMGVPPVVSSLDIGREVVAIANKMGRRLKVIGSTDLTHYGRNYGFSPQGTGSAAVDWVRQKNDRRFIEALLALDPFSAIEEGLSHHNACCAGAAATALAAGKAMGATQAAQLAYATSYDKQPAESFVGYVGIVF